jgi:hypothetical protein
MSRYYVLVPPAARDPDLSTLFVRDGFSWFGFLLPLPWLLLRRLWLLAGLAFCLYMAAALAAEYWQLEALPFAFGLILSLWVGLEGGHVRAMSLQARGWRLDAVIVAANLESAEEQYFAERGRSDVAPPRPVLPASRAVPNGNQRPDSNTMALGLIQPRGGR